MTDKGNPVTCNWLVAADKTAIPVWVLLATLVSVVSLAVSDWLLPAVFNVAENVWMPASILVNV